MQSNSQRRQAMRKICVLMMAVIIAGGILFPLQTFGQSDRRVLMIPREGTSGDLDMAIKMEVGVMLKLFKDAGFQVDIATPSGEPYIGRYGKIEKVQKLSKIKMDNYAGIILVCMAMGAFPGPSVSSETVAIVKEALNTGKPVAATSSASTILAEAGLLNGKKYAYYRDPLETDASWSLTDQRYKDGIYSGKGVVQDGKIITSGVCPVMAAYTAGMDDCTTEITQKFIVAIGPK
jgi:putative intracellular protease/amidase